MGMIIGTPYPIRRHPRGYLHGQEGTNQIRSCLLSLLMTEPGERVMLPEYGTPLRQLLFDPNDTTIAFKAKQVIKDSISRWEPRITVQSLEVTAPDPASLDVADDMTETGSMLFIRIIFVDPQNISDVQELKMELPLGGL